MTREEPSTRQRAREEGLDLDSLQHGLEGGLSVGGERSQVMPSLARAPGGVAVLLARCGGWG